MNFRCEYCGTNFSRAYNLKQHTQKAKYCLAIQKKDSTKYICKLCGKELSRKDSLIRHEEICKDYKEEKVDRLEKHIAQLTHLVEKILTEQPRTAAPTTNVNNRNFVANLQPIVEEEIQALALEYLTIDDLRKGVDGLVTFVLNYPLGKQVVCTDKSRKKLQYRDAAGEVINDPGGVKLSQTFFKAINPRNQELIRNEYDGIHTRVQDIIARGASHDENVSQLMMEAMEIQSLGAKCEEIAQGGDNEMRADFINRLAKQL